MKKALFVLLLSTIAIHAPWRLMALAVETLVVQPGPTRFSSDNDKYWDALELEARLIDLGYMVGYGPQLIVNGQSAYGLMAPGEHVIMIDQRLSWNARFAVLAHEGGHVLQRGWYTRAQGEAFAESVAALVAHDGLREHARYMSGFKMDAIWVMLTDWRAIYRAARTLEDR